MDKQRSPTIRRCKQRGFRLFAATGFGSDTFTGDGAERGGRSVGAAYRRPALVVLRTHRASGQAVESNKLAGRSLAQLRNNCARRVFAEEEPRGEQQACREIPLGSIPLSSSKSTSGCGPVGSGRVLWKTGRAGPGPEEEGSRARA